MLAGGRSSSFPTLRGLILGLLLVLSCAHPCDGYSILTHEALIDAAWKDGIEPWREIGNSGGYRLYAGGVEGV